MHKMNLCCMLIYTLRVDLNTRTFWSNVAIALRSSIIVTICCLSVVCLFCLSVTLVYCVF